MNRTKSWIRSALRAAGVPTLALGVLLCPGQALADVDEGKKNEEDVKKAEQGQGQGPRPGVPGGQGGQGVDPLDDPLKKILELMREVEDRLFEADTGEFTQAEQRRIIEAMKFEDKTSQALEELIRKIEEQAQQQSSSSSSSSSQQQQQQRNQQQQKNETPEQRAERERQERERQEREKQEEAQRRMQQQQQQPQQAQQEPRNGQEQRGQQERKEGVPPEDRPELNPRDPAGAGRWGQLPQKLHQDAQNAQNQEPPGRWRELIERYRDRLASPQR